MPGYDEATVKTIRQPLLILAVDLRVRAANPAFYRTFEVAPEDTLGEFVYDLGNGQWDIPQLRRLLEDVLTRDSAVEDYEVEHEFPQIGPKSMILNARRLQQDGAAEGLILLAIEDMTTQRASERALERYARDLERSNRDLEQLAYVASHDLQEPLRTVSSFASLLERRYRDQLDDKARQYIDFMTDAAGRMQRLIKDLLAFSRVTRNEEDFELTKLEGPLEDALARLEGASPG
jgi:two-component system CheB/CheR fusion protein